jgi:rhamnogalacturonyl hydrolase YesR
MEEAVFKSFQKLKHYCEKQEFKGWDPYDGLNSHLFHALPIIRNNCFCRLAWIQLFKRSPINFRVITGVKKNLNTKGLGLFLTGYCNRYLQEKNQEYLDKINLLAEKIIELQNKDYSGSCWGYNFDWQARAFFQPKHTPTIVATSFVADSLLNAYEITNNKRYLDTALSSAEFVLKDLNRTYDEKGNFSFSYSPLDKTQVFNASLLGARLLSRCFVYTKNENYKTEAQKAIAFVCDRQQSNGAWAYGTLPFHQWIDNFHTGFNLECISDYKKYTSDHSFDLPLQKGIDFYLATFFTEEGAGKYYHDKLYPIDIHSPAQLMVSLSKLGLFQQQLDLANRVMKWAIDNMQDKEGYFYYQKKQFFSSHIPYMRWAQAWMFYAMSYYLKEMKK